MSTLAEILAQPHWRPISEPITAALESWEPASNEESNNLLAYSSSVREHYEAAIEALGEMDAIEREMAVRVQQLIAQGATRSDNDDAYQALRTRFTRRMRFMVTEACAALESLMYELATVLRLRRSNGSAPEMGDWVGFYREGFSKSLRAYEHANALDLDKFLDGIHDSTAFTLLDELRRKSFHRAIIPISEHVIVANDPTPSPPYFRFVLPSHGNKPLVSELLSGLHAVVVTISGVYERSAKML